MSEGEAVMPLALRAAIIIRHTNTIIRITQTTDIAVLVHTIITTMGMDTTVITMEDIITTEVEDAVAEETTTISEAEDLVGEEEVETTIITEEVMATEE